MHNGRMQDANVIPAAGGVVWRRAGSKRTVELLLVHRPRYNDWTFPKGKLDPGESIPAAAVREIREESGLKVRLTLPLPQIDYRVKGGVKQVSWWLARPLGGKTAFKANDEVDKARWLSPREARAKLSYPHDRKLVDAVEDLVSDGLHRTRTLIILRHAAAEPRGDWTGDQDDRPLTEAGQLQAKNLVPVLRAFGAKKIITSPALRCRQTVEPLAAERGLRVTTDLRFAEGTDPARVHVALNDLLDLKAPVVLCTHRPVLPDLFAALPLIVDPLEPGQARVVHHRRGRVIGHELI